MKLLLKKVTGFLSCYRMGNNWLGTAPVVSFTKKILSKISKFDGKIIKLFFLSKKNIKIIIKVVAWSIETLLSNDREKKKKMLVEKKATTQYLRSIFLFVGFFMQGLKSQKARL